MPTTLGRQLVPALLLLLVCSSARRVEAQDVTEVTLKGAFLFNFARSPNTHADTVVSACVFGDRAVADAFAKTVKGKQLAGRAIAVTTIAANESIPPCHLLYLSGVAEARIAEIVSTLRDTPVLTVSDSDTFTKRGGIVQIFVESGKMKFRINSRSARRARLQLSSRLLALAEVVDEDVASVAAVPSTDLFTSIGPDLASRGVELFGIDWARRFTAWGRN